MNWRRILLVFSALAVLVFGYVLYSALNTIGQLDEIEQARDRWQRPDEILGALELRPGSRVVDLGSGAGYFSLKIAAAVGRNGRVDAVDLRRLSLWFLKARAVRNGQRNIHTSVATPTDPRLPPQSADAVLISNTYHELANRSEILSHVMKALRSGGRLVIADREPHPGGSTHHEVALSQAAAEVAMAGFRVEATHPSLLMDPDGERWWLLAARKP